MKTWVKGGLWGIVVAIILLFLQFIPFIGSFLLRPVAISAKFACSVLGGCVGNSPLTAGGIYIIIIEFVYGFIIGSIIGLIIGKIKEKKNVKK